MTDPFDRIKVTGRIVARMMREIRRQRRAAYWQGFREGAWDELKRRWERIVFNLALAAVLWWAIIWLWANWEKLS